MNEGGGSVETRDANLPAVCEAEAPDRPHCLVSRRQSWRAESQPAPRQMLGSVQQSPESPERNGTMKYQSDRVTLQPHPSPT